MVWRSCQVRLEPTPRTSTPGDLPLAVDGQWASWGLWSQCSSTDCGNGTRTRHRLCDPGPLHEGRQCVGNSMQLAACISPECQGKAHTHTHLSVG